MKERTIKKNESVSKLNKRTQITQITQITNQISSDYQKSKKNIICVLILF